MTLTKDNVNRTILRLAIHAGDRSVKLTNHAYLDNDNHLWLGGGQTSQPEQLAQELGVKAVHQLPMPEIPPVPFKEI